MSPENEFDPDEEGLAEEFLCHAMMDEARAYLERGRRLRSLTNDEILDTWTALFERWFGSKRAEIARDMNDAAAEIRLRGLEMPFERVKDKTRALEAELIRRGLEDGSPEIDLKIDDFLSARSKPKKLRLNRAQPSVDGTELAAGLVCKTTTLPPLTSGTASR